MTPTNVPDDPRWDRLIHLVAGELPADEAAALRRWAGEDPERAETLARLEQIWQATAPAPEREAVSWDAEAELRRIKQGTPGAGRVIARLGSNLDRIQARRPHVGPALAVAAMLALVIGGGLLWQARAPGIVSPAPVAMAEYRTAPGERLQLRLPDGTEVMLAPGGVLRRPSTYGVRDRVVQLEGEGYFVVTHDSTRPFAVQTARLVARDLGTRFVVRAYPEDPATDVVVTEGVVAVGRTATASGGLDTPVTTAPLSSDSLVLTPRQRARATGAGRLVLTRGVALDPYLAWTEGRLVFNDTPLREVQRQLERWYGAEVRLASADLGRLRVTGAFDDEPVTQVLDAVARSLGLMVRPAGAGYEFAPRPN